MTRFSKLYVSALTAVWIGYGLYSMIMHKPDSMTIFLFGLGFSIVFFIAVRFSQWLMKNNKRIDLMSKEMLTQNDRNGRRI